MLSNLWKWILRKLFPINAKTLYKSDWIPFLKTRNVYKHNYLDSYLLMQTGDTIRIHKDKIVFCGTLTNTIELNIVLRAIMEPYQKIIIPRSVGMNIYS